MTQVRLGNALLTVDKEGNVNITSPHQTNIWTSTHPHTICYLSITTYLERVGEGMVLSVNTKHGVDHLLVLVPESQQQTWLDQYQNPKYMFVPVITY